VNLIPFLGGDSVSPALQQLHRIVTEHAPVKKSTLTPVFLFS
jgi:hypothetical protein